MGHKQKTEEKERKKRERAKVGDNNGQATHGARKPPGPTFFTDVIIKRTPTSDSIRTTRKCSSDMNKEICFKAQSFIKKFA